MDIFITPINSVLQFLYKYPIQWYYNAFAPPKRVRWLIRYDNDKFMKAQTTLGSPFQYVPRSDKINEDFWNWNGRFYTIIFINALILGYMYNDKYLAIIIGISFGIIIKGLSGIANSGVIDFNINKFNRNLLTTTTGLDVNRKCCMSVLLDDKVWKLGKNQSLLVSEEAYQTYKHATKTMTLGEWLRVNEMVKDDDWVSTSVQSSGGDGSRIGFYIISQAITMALLLVKGNKSLFYRLLPILVAIFIFSINGTHFWIWWHSAKEESHTLRFKHDMVGIAISLALTFGFMILYSPYHRRKRRK